MKKEKLLSIFRFIVLLVGWFGVIGHFIMKVTKNSMGLNPVLALLDSISHYTIQTNMLVLIWITYACIKWIKKGKIETHNSVFKTGITIYITFTFAIYALLLRSLWNPTGMDFVLQYVTHYVTPVAFMIDWVVCELINRNQQKKDIKCAVKWLIYPLSYFIYVMIYGGITGRYMYPFLNVPTIGYLGTFKSALILSILFIISGVIYLKCSEIIQSLKKKFVKVNNNEVSQ